MRTVLLYVQVIVLTGVVLVFAFDLSRATPYIPFYYSVSGGDLYFFLTMDKTIADTGWYTENPWLGAPAVMKLYDFPGNDTGLMLGIKLLIALLGNPFVAANAYYLMTFVTAGIACLYVLRVLGVGGQVAVATSLLFTFLPFHFWRGPFHPAYSTYHVIPLVAMVALWLCSSESLLFANAESGRLCWAWSWRRTLPATVTCVLTSVSGAYYAFFGTFLILAGGAIGLMRKRSLDRLLDPLAAAVLITALFIAQLIPNVLYYVRQGPNPLPWTRPLSANQAYSLRVINLLRPVPGHRISWLDFNLPAERTKPPPDLAWLYNETNEAEVDTPLGTLGALGFLTLVTVALAAPCALTLWKKVVGDLGQLNLAALLLGVTGGFGEVVAVYFTTMIRCYNRISIFIGFFALAAVALLVSRGQRVNVFAPDLKSRWVRWGSPVAFWGVTALALLDQIPPVLTPDHARDAAAFQADKEFVTAVEQALAPRSMVFQLPQHTFPEYGRRFQMYDYSLFRGYLHSRQLRWSYGALRGREAEVHGQLALQTPPKLIDTLIEAGFSGLYVDRKGYEAGAPDLIRAILRRIPQEPITNRDHSLLFFRLPAAPAVHGSS